MKYIFLCLLLWSVVPVQAQIHNPSQHFIEVGGGLLDGVKTGKTDNAGKWLKVGFGKYGSREGVWQGAILLQEKYYQVSEVGLVSINQYFLDGNFTPKFIRSVDKKFYLSPTVGVLLGYEAANDKLLFPDGDTRLSKWLLGFTCGISGEYNFSNRAALAAYSRGTILPSSKIQEFHFHYGLALRLNFFKQ